MLIAGVTLTGYISVQLCEVPSVSAVKLLRQLIDLLIVLSY